LLETADSDSSWSVLQLQKRPTLYTKETYTKYKRDLCHAAEALLETAHSDSSWSVLQFLFSKVSAVVDLFRNLISHVV